MNNDGLNKIISKDNIKRLIKDVKEIINEPLTSDGIFYQHDEEDMLKGYALIIGNVDTPYFGGFYLFELDFPKDYPFSPPKITYKTNGENIRFNPNLYTNGKVCISILNTWHGDPWSSCQTIKSILLTLCTVLNSTPLLNEPGVRKEQKDEIEKYNSIIYYSNISIAICDMLDKSIQLPKFHQYFYLFMKETFLKNYEGILKELKEKSQEIVTVKVNYYNLNVIIDFSALIIKLNACNLNILKSIV